MISHQNATTSVLQFLGSNAGEGFDLSEAQGEALVKHLTQRVKVDIVMQPEAVLSFATELFPPKEEQTEQDVIDVLNRYAASGHWEKVAIGYAPPWSAGGKGIGSKANFVLLANAIKEFRSTGKTLRVDHVAEIVYTLASRGVLERIPQTVVVEKPVPPPSPQEQARELAKKIAAKERSLNDRTKSPIRGAKESAQPLVQPKVVLTEEQRQAKEAANRETDAIIAEAQHRISMFQGRNHARTFSARAELQELFKNSMDEGVEANEILRRVDAKIDQLAGSNSIR